MTKKQDIIYFLLLLVGVLTLNISASSAIKVSTVQAFATLPVVVLVIALLCLYCSDISSTTLSILIASRAIPLMLYTLYTYAFSNSSLLFAYWVCDEIWQICLYWAALRSSCVIDDRISSWRHFMFLGAYALVGGALRPVKVSYLLYIAMQALGLAVVAIATGLKRREENINRS